MRARVKQDTAPMRLATPRILFLSLGVFAAPMLAGGCSSDESGTAITLASKATLGDVPCDSWTATLREENQLQSGSCGSSLDFSDVEPNRSYDFDIRGYAGGKICWSTQCRATNQGLSQCDAVQSLCGN